MFTAVVCLTACADSDSSPSDADTDRDIAIQTDSDIAPEIDADSEQRSDLKMRFLGRLCAAGGAASSASGQRGFFCLSPAEIAQGHRASKPTGSWLPGPTILIVE